MAEQLIFSSVVGCTTYTYDQHELGIPTNQPHSWRQYLSNTGFQPIIIHLDVCCERSRDVGKGQSVQLVLNSD